MESWTEGIECCGTYYAEWVLTAHENATVTCYGTRSSQNSSSAPGQSGWNDKENVAPTNEKGTKVMQTFAISDIYIKVVHLSMYCPTLTTPQPHLCCVINNQVKYV